MASAGAFLAELEALVEASSHDPFQTSRRLGPGPKGTTRDMRHGDRYQCACKKTGRNTVCKCRNRESGTRTIEISGNYKAKYGALYRKWRKRHPKR